MRKNRICLLKMMCENEYCIYQKNRACMLDIISIDEFGKCSECIIPNIPHDFLEELKRETFKIIESSDKQKSF